MYGNQPARDSQGSLRAYRKPLIVLVDEFSISAGDIFPAMLQDNRRGPLVGTRTNGAGGSVAGFPAGTYSESDAGNTNSLVTRIAPVQIPGYPDTPYIENVGAHADIPIDYMTRENLLPAGRPFVEAFTRAIVDEIRVRYLEIVSRHSRKCLDVFGAFLDHAAGVIQWSCPGGPNQQWRLEPTADGAYRLVARHSGKALDVFGGLRTTSLRDSTAPRTATTSCGRSNRQLVVTFGSWRVTAENHWMWLARRSMRAPR